MEQKLIDIYQKKVSKTKTTGYFTIKRENLLKNMKEHPVYYFMILPGLFYFLLFRIIPNLGLVISFQNYNILLGIRNSPWVGFRHFIDFFRYPEFSRILRNTVIIASLQILFTFPAPIILALLLNEIKQGLVKKSLQTIVYFPHFLSWVIVSQLFINLVNPDSGLINSLYTTITGNEPIYFMIQQWFFRPIVLISSIWKTAGFSSIVYLAALTAISPALYEAAAIDGATRFQQLKKITLPLLTPTIIVLLLLNIGNFLDLGFEQIWTLSNPLVWPVADIFDTYVYRRGILEGSYSVASAVGLFKSLVSFILLFITNKLSQKYTEVSIL